jgi:xylulokinase
MSAATGSAAKAGAWSITGCMLSAGGSLQWCRDAIFPGVVFETLMEEASRVRPGCDGLLFMPHLTGERCPYPDPAARGGWIGLTSRHTRGHLVRSVIEGVTFGMGQILDLVRGLGVSVEKARLGGGGAKSVLWRQMQADVYGCPVALTNTEEGPALGAALLAGVGAGVFESVEGACAAAIHETAVIQPSAERGVYEPYRGVYGELYSDLRERFEALLKAENGA